MIKEKHKEFIKGILFSVGTWGLIKYLFPVVDLTYDKATASLPLAIILMAIGVFWK